mgnify:CR=1 FL=1
MAARRSPFALQEEYVSNYEAEPTLERFHLSNAFIRGARGPWGCTAGDHEVLTRTGWVRMDAWAGQDILVCTEDTKRSWFELADYVVEPCKSFLHFASRGLDMLVSDEHRILHFKKFNRDTPRVATAAAIAKAHAELKEGWDGLIPCAFAAPENAVGVDLTDADLRVMVMVCADGSFSANTETTRCTVCVRKERKKQRLMQLLVAAGIDWTEYRNPARPTEIAFRFNAPERNKSLAKYWQASAAQLAIIAEEVRYWDGQADSGYSDWAFFSTDEAEAEFVAYAFSTQGRRASVSFQEPENSTWKRCYVVAGTTRPMAGLRYGANKPEIARVASEDGKKYCFTTTSGFFVTRRNGKICVTGNSGKSVACVEEMLMRAHQQAPDRYKRRRTCWAAVRNCYDDKTEILTENRGFVLFKDLIECERVAMLQDGHLVWTVPTYYYQADYVGEMVGCENEGVDFLVTPDHHLWVSKKETRKQIWSAYRHERAQDCFGNPTFRVKRDASWIGVDPGRSVDLCEWLGFWFAEGYAAKYDYPDRKEPHWRCVISQKKELPYVRDLFARAELAFFESEVEKGCKHFRLSMTDKAKTLVNELVTFGNSLSKHVPQWLKDATPQHIRAFIHGYAKGDGQITVDGTPILHTSSRKLADDLQELALKVGLVANINRKAIAGTAYCINGHSGVMNADYWSVSISTRHQPKLCVGGYANKYAGWYRTRYCGQVYCVEVPTHVVYVRRNNKAMWCGQTYGMLKTTTMRTWVEWVPEHIAPINRGEPMNAHLVVDLADGTTVDMEVWFISCDKPADVTKLRGLELTGAWLNEASELDKSILDTVSARVGRFPPKKDAPLTWTGVIMDTNSMDDDHWWYKLAEGVEDREEQEEYEELIRKLREILVSIGMDRPLFEFFDQPPALLEQSGSYIPNPEAENVRHQQLGYAYWLMLCAGKSRDWIDTFILNKYGKVVDGKPVYSTSEYDDTVHGKKLNLNPYTGKTINIGIDFGLSPAIIPGQVSPTGRLTIFGELCAKERSMGMRRFMNDAAKPYLVERFGRTDKDGNPWKYKFWGDPAGNDRADSDESTGYQMVREAGFEIEPAPTNNFSARRDSVAWFLTKREGFAMDGSCIMLRKGFRAGYHYRRIQVSGEARFADQPYDNKYTHPHDALQYLALPFCAIEVPAAGYKALPQWMQKVRAQGQASRPYMKRGGRMAA